MKYGGAMRYQIEPQEDPHFVHIHFDERVVEWAGPKGYSSVANTFALDLERDVEGVADAELRENGYCLHIKKARLVSWSFVFRNVFEFLRARLDVRFEEVTDLPPVPPTTKKYVRESRAMRLLDAGSWVLAGAVVGFVCFLVLGGGRVEPATFIIGGIAGGLGGMLVYPIPLYKRSSKKEDSAM